jgi:deaminated glutathione amidase
MIKVAAIQMNSRASVELNLQTCREMVTRAAHQGAQLVLLPENFASMPIHERDKVTLSENLGDGPIQDFLKQLASELELHIVAGSIPIKSADEEHVYSMCLVFDNKGKRIGQYTKMHLFDVIVSESERYAESETIMPGTEPVVIDTALGKIGLSICYDLRFPEMYRRLCTRGAEIIVVPSAFTKLTGLAHWEVLLRARAIENLCFVIAANQTGTHESKRETYGHSMVIDHWGSILSQCEYEPGIAIAELDFVAMQEKRKHFPVLEHIKIEI